MVGFRRKPLAVIVFLLFAPSQLTWAANGPVRLEFSSRLGMQPPGAAAGVQADALASPDSDGNGDAEPSLRVERRFDLLARKQEQLKMPKAKDSLLKKYAPEEKPKEEAHPVFVSAENIEGRADEVTIAEGNAELRKFGSLVLADKLTYRPLDDEVEAVGNVLLRQEDSEISGPYMRMKLSEQIGYFEEADYKINKLVTNKYYRLGYRTTKEAGLATSSGVPLLLNVPAAVGLQPPAPLQRPSDSYGHARRIDFEGESQVRLSDATYSTCKPDSQDWYLRGDEIRLDYDAEVGEATNAKLTFKDTPIFFSPSATFSLNHNRKSGILPGTFAASTKNGLDLTVPVYWNIAPNYDATLYPRYMSKRGLQLGGEARYKDYYGEGYARMEYVPNDLIADRTRYAYGINLTQTLGRGLSTTINWNGVSDDRYWEDFSSRLLNTSQTQLPRLFSLSYAPFYAWTLNLTQLKYQTLQPDPANPVSRPYFIEPQLSATGRLYDLAGLADFGFYAQYSRFTHPTKVEGARTVVFPQISFPVVTPGYSIIPKVGVHATQYDLSRQDAGQSQVMSRVLPLFSLDGSLTFERHTEFAGTDYLQTLEPRLFYVYIPYRDQSHLPVFDSALGDFNFAQIFSENRYSGYDRVNDANQLTAAVTTRLLDPATGTERLKAMLGQRYYFKEQRVTITDEVARQRQFSNFLAAFSGLVAPGTYAEAAWEYNYHKSQNERLSAGVRYQPEPAKVLSAAYRFSRDALNVGQVEQVDIAGQWPLSKQWYFVGRYNYSIRDKQLLEAIGGLEYNPGCWAARFVVQRLEAVGGSPNTTFFFQLELNDFASIGSNPISLLRRTIPGYGKVNELPTTGSLLTE